MEKITGDRRPKVVVIAGPTASGKTSLSVKLALALNGEIINADSMQVYREMDLGTAKPTLEEQRGIPHHLMDVVDPDEEFNAAIYRNTALPIIKEVNIRGKACLVVGGTGLYIKSLLGGLIKCSPADPDLRESLRSECETFGPARLHKRLESLDPESAGKIHPHDTVRITRALEIFHLTKTPLSDLSRNHGFQSKGINALKLCLEVDRDQLYHRINKRTSAMVESGLREETENLLKKGFSPDIKSMKSIGYRHIVKHLKGDWSIEEMTHYLKRDTRRYAKRQLTWFRADPEITWVAPENFDLILEKIKAFLNKVP